LATAEADNQHAAPCTASSVTLRGDCLRSWLRST